MAPLNHLCIRSFSTTPCHHARSAAAQLKHIYEKHSIPPYPPGPSPWYKQSNFGLFGSLRPQSGNTVSERTEIKNRRKWFPNIQNQRLWSGALNKFVKIRVATRVLRTIDKVGGLDEYLLGEKRGRVNELGAGGWALRWYVMRTDWYRERRRRERIELGLPEEGIEWMKSQIRAEAGVSGEGQALEREQAIDRALRRVDKEADTYVELGDMGPEAVGRPKAAL